MRAISKRTHQVIGIISTTVNILFLITMTSVALAVSILYGMKKFDIVPTSILTYIFIVFALVVGGMFIFVTVLVVTSGILVIRTIKNTTRKVTQTLQNSRSSNRISLDTQSFEKKIQSPFKITFGLMIGLILCIILEIFSVAIAAGVNNLEEIKAVWHFLNCLGVLIYSVLVLFLFYPLFLDSELALKEIEKRNQISKEQTKSGVDSEVNASVVSNVVVPEFKLNEEDNNANSNDQSSQMV